MKAEKQFTPDIVQRLISYDPETGKMIWEKRPESMFAASGSHTAAHRCAIWNAKNAGRPALEIRMPQGYLQGAIGGHKVYAHRVAWAIAKGEWPKKHVDHINGDKSDNRIANLRDVSVSMNLHNRPAQKNSQSGVKGVCWDKAKGMWLAQICVNKKNHHLGHFASIGDASSAYKAASQRLVWGAV